MPGDDAEKGAPTGSSPASKHDDDDDDEQPTPPSRKLYPILRKHAHGFFKFIFSHRMIPVLKGTLAFILAFVLVFLRKFDDLSAVPAAYTSMIIVIIAGGPGKTVGACVQGVCLALLGVGLGSGFFAILAKLVDFPVAQGVVFAVIVYLMSLVKALGLRWFGFSLLAILMAFNGIYTSILLGGVFSPKYLEEYLIAYLWGGAITLGVNILIFPMSSERELRKTLVISLEHISTFAALIAKGYTLTSTQEEREAREAISQTVKADFTFLLQKIDETSIEINWSKFSMADYQLFVEKVRALQSNLITAHVSLQRFDKQDEEVIRNLVLPATQAAFIRLRRDIDLTIREIGDQLGCKPLYVPTTQTGYLEFLALEREFAQCTRSKRAKRKDLRRRRRESLTAASDSEDARGTLVLDLDDVARRLAMETTAETPQKTAVNTPAADSPTLTRSPSHIRTELEGPTAAGTTEAHPSIPKGSPAESPVTLKKKLPVVPVPKAIREKYGAHVLKQDFEDFETAQKDVLHTILTSADPGDGTLRIQEPLPSVQQLYGGDYLRGDVEEGDYPMDLIRQRIHRTSTKATTAASTIDDEHQAPEEENVAQDEDSEAYSPTTKANRSLVRVYSMLFAMDHFVRNLVTLHDSVAAGGGVCKRRARFHFHIYELLHRPTRKQKPRDAGFDPKTGEEEEEARELSIKEALAILENREYTPVVEQLWEKVNRCKAVLQSDASVFAAKVAAAATVFAVLLFADTTRQWFINYSLTAGLLTVVVALAPTLGQSLVTFVIQISGSGLGTLVGLAILEMFHNVGGYTYNPFGICAILTVYALPLNYLLYEHPSFFILSLLALNSAGALIVYQHVYENYYHRHVDSPALRAGKAMVSLSVALAIVLVFQLFILRTPARRTLRRSIAHVTYSMLSYNTILQAFARSVLPANPKHRPSKAAVRRVERELIHREARMQAEIIAIAPLMVFANAEPSFGLPFRADVYNRIIRANQVMLDRLKEARGAIGIEPFDPFILENLVAVLSPYRRRHSRTTKTGLYLCAASLSDKAPLPHDSVLINHLLNDFIHDALLLSSRLAIANPAGIRSDSFTRYWFYLLSVGGIPTQLKEIELACKDLFGELEDDPKLR